jgi:hypothetical protein
MANFCIPPKLHASFKAKLKDGTIDPDKMADMTSAERRKFLAPIVGGDEIAQEVNALFESKLLLRDVKRGLVTWAKTVGGITEPTRKDLLAKIQRMPTDLLNPVDQSKFLADLAATKLGVTVTADEAKQIFELSQRAEAALAARTADPATWEAYGHARIALTEYLESLKPSGRTWTQLAIEIAGAGRSMITTLDLSAPLIQGWGMETSGNWRTAARKMLTFFGNEKNYQANRAWIAGHPDYDLARKAGLSLTELGPNVALREEAIPSSLPEQGAEWLKRVTGGVVNIPVRASNRAYVGFNNYVRFKTFTDWTTAARLAGGDVSVGSKLAEDFARTINNFSGRGGVRDPKWDTAIALANTVFFSPRKNIGTFNMFFSPLNMVNPLTRTDKLARTKAMKLLMGSMAYTGAFIGLANMMGFEAELDPRHTNFLKIHVGNRWVDITGGNAIFVRTMARLISNQSVSSTGRFTDFASSVNDRASRASEIERFARNKLAPQSSSIADALYGADAVGRPFSVTQELRDNVVPMFMDTFIETASEVARNEPGSWMTAFTLPMALLGAGVQAPLKDETAGRWDVWGDPVGTDHSDSPVVQKLEELGMELNMPANMIRGVKLTPEQYDAYSYVSGIEMQLRTGAAIEIPGFDEASPGEQETMLRAAIAGAREDARMDMMGQYPELLDEADRLQQLRIQQGSPAAVRRREAAQ